MSSEIALKQLNSLAHVINGMKGLKDTDVGAFVVKEDFENGSLYALLERLSDKVESRAENFTHVIEPTSLENIKKFLVGYRTALLHIIDMNDDESVKLKNGVVQHHTAWLVNRIKHKY